MKNRPAPIFSADGKLVEALEEYINAHHAGHSNALASSKKAIEDTNLPTLSNYRKSQLLDIVSKLAEIHPTDDAIYLYRFCLAKYSAFGRRFRMQGPINKSGFTRGTIKTLYDCLQEKISTIPNISAKISKSNEQVDNGIKEENYDTALARFEYAIKLHPYNAEANFQLGELLANDENFEKAFEHYCEAIWLDPSKSKFYYARSNCYFKRKQHSVALEDINEAIDLANDLEAPVINPIYFALRGQIYRKMKEYTKAIADFNQAIKHATQKDMPFLISERGLTYDYSGDIKTAINAYIKAYHLAEKPSSDQTFIYRNLKFVLVEASTEELDSLSKNDILKMLTDIIAFLTPSDALTLCNQVFLPETPLNIRHHKEEKILGIFADKSHEGLEKLKALTTSLEEKTKTASNRPN